MEKKSQLFQYGLLREKNQLYQYCLLRQKIKQVFGLRVVIAINTYFRHYNTRRWNLMIRVQIASIPPGSYFQLKTLASRLI